MINPFSFSLRTRLVFGAGSITKIGELAHELKLNKTLLVADRGLQTSGHVDRVVYLLNESKIDVVPFHDFDTNPDTTMVERGHNFATSHDVDSIIGLGGGSSLDCAKGINFLLTNGGTMSDYQGYEKALNPLLPMIALPTTSGTGSEAQSYAVISDAVTHLKIACGTPSAAFKVALLDPELTLSQPASVTADSGFDAIAHAVETAVTTRRTEISNTFSREAFRLLIGNYEQVLQSPNDLTARSLMHLGAFYAGVAIEQSMLGAAHACANPLTARYDITHGAALAILLPHVVRWNTTASRTLYEDFVISTINKTNKNSGEQLANLLIKVSKAGGFFSRLRDIGVSEQDLETLAEQAGQQWTAAFNPIPFNASGALEIYQCAY